MKNGVATTSQASDPKLLYVRCMYHTFWYGPFASEDDVAAALRTLDAADEYWDYDCFAIHYGVADMKDAINDPVYVTQEAREKIESARKCITPK